MSEKAVKHAQSLFPENDIEIYKMNLEKIEFADGYFDTVCLSNSMHHFENIDKVLAELMRVLKPGGLVLIVEMYKDGVQNAAQQTHIMMHHWIAVIDTLHGNYHRETYNRDEIIGFAQRLPLEHLEMEDFNYPVDNPKDPHEIEPLIKNVQDAMKRCETIPSSSAVCNEGNHIIERMKNVGVMTATKLFITGIKK